MSRFAPVHLPPERALGRKASMTFLKHYELCPRSGFFYAAQKGAMQTIEMVRGTAEHTMLERAINLMVEQGEPMLPPDLMKAIVNEVLAEQAVPIREHDFLRESAYRWAEEWTIDPAQVIACETLLVLELAGWQVRCKVDFAEAQAGGLVVKVDDWKSSRAAPGYEEIARKRPDGTLAAKSFQLILYALALAFGQPVRVESCPACGGSGKLQLLPPTRTGPNIVGCHECKGRGTVEVVEPFPLAGQAERFDLALVFPGIETREGLMVRRPVSLTRLELGEYRESLIAILRRLEESERTGDWPAVISDEACKYCPCKPECPIPREVRDHAGLINSMEDAVEAAEVLDREKAQSAAKRKELKEWAKAHGVEIRYGLNKAWRFGYSEVDKIEHKDAMWDAIERSVDYGEPFERGRFTRTVGSTTFDAVTLSEDELQEEAREREERAA